jgi:hemerythrin-like domain-containing protein
VDIIDLLIQQHREADALFQGYQQSPGDEKAELAIQLAEALTLHATIEERWIYPVARRIVGEDKIDHSEEEHGEMKTLIADMLRSRNDLAALDSKVSELEGVVKRHVEDEERTVLPQLGQKATEADIGMSCADIVRTASEVRREEMNKLQDRPSA